MKNHNLLKHLLLILKVIIILFFFSPFLEKSYSLNEIFELYEPPQVLSMGKAIVANPDGYLSHYFNPAGFAKTPKRRKEFILFDFEWVGGLSSISRVWEGQSFGINRLSGPFKKNPSQYTFFSFASVPAVSFRNWGVAALGSYRFAGRSDGTNLDVDSVIDVGPSIGGAMNFAGNLVKVGGSIRIINRNQLKGVYAHSDIENSDTLKSLTREGTGVGGDLGILVTLPYRFLPTLGVTWKDVLHTRFMKTKFINSKSNGAPDKINQSFHAGLSVHPSLSRRWKTSVVFEFKHIERVDLPFRKKAHFGVQFINEKSFYLWLGMNNLYPTFGMALRLSGGDLEVGTYGAEVEGGSTYKEDRRVFMRYTIAF